MIERDLRTYLANSPTIRHEADGGIWPGSSPSGRRGRRLIVRRISGNRQYSLTNEVGITEHIVQIDAYGESPSVAAELFQLVRNRLSGYRGVIGDGFIQGTRIIAERLLREPPEDKSDKWIHRYSADFAMFYGEAVPTHT